MANNSLYVIIPTEKLQAKQDNYVKVGFVNRGEIRKSLNGSLTLIEESPDKFNQEHLNDEDILQFTEKEIRLYLQEHYAEWNKEVEKTMLI